MSRQRLRPSLDDSAYGICRNCSGIGKVRSTESLALSVLRLVGEEARKEKTKSVIADIPSDTANYLLNEKREWINDIEEREGIDVVLKALAAIFFLKGSDVIPLFADTYLHPIKPELS